MKYERVCPLCGGSIERRHAEVADGMTDAVYGKRLSLSYVCDNPECGFGLAFPFDGDVYLAYTCEEIRRRTKALPADERVRALLDAIDYCRRGDSDRVSVALSQRVGEMFLEALGEIYEESRMLLHRFSYREPNEQRLRRSRRALAVFLRFLALMEDRYPTEELETAFLGLREELLTLDYHYELGMLALETDIAEAEVCFGAGSRAGGIRSKVAYAKYILADKAENDEDHIPQKDAFALLAPYSQEACYEYMSRAEIGKDDVSAVLFSYEAQEYGGLSADGKLAFLRLALTACTEYYEPALARLFGSVQSSASDPEAQVALSEEARRVLSELSRLTEHITEQCAALALFSEQREKGDLIDLDAERSVLDEANALLEYVIGCCMYYKSCFDAKKHFDIEYFRVASGHLSCFLASSLATGALIGERVFPSLIGVRDLHRICENARELRRILTTGAGLGEEG